MLPKRPRLKTFDYVGTYRHFLTFCAHLRQPLFTSAETVVTARAAILRPSVRRAFAVHAYVFMPDHVHLLVEGTSADSDLCRFVKLAKQYSGYAFSRGCGAPLWQPSYYDRVLRDDEDTSQVMAYIANNPVRAGYVVEWLDYPFAGSATMSRDEMADLLRDNSGRHGSRNARQASLKQA